MLRNTMLFLIFVTLTVNCSNLQNNNDQTQLVCGKVDEQAEAWIRIENAESIETILVKDGATKLPAMSEKSCISITKDDRDFRLLVRDSASKTLFFTMEMSMIPPGLSRFSLTPHNKSQTSSTQARCPASEIHASDKLEIYFKRNPSDLNIYSMVEIKIFNQEKTLVWQRTMALGDNIDPVPLELTDGLYNIEMRNFDAFSPQSLSESTPETCILAIDRSHPVVDLDARSFASLDGFQKALKVPPGAKLEFTTDRESNVDNFVCLKQRQNERVQSEPCEFSEYKSIGTSFNAPGTGAWDLYTFAKDKAGNAAPLNHYTLYIYHDSLIEEIRALSKTIQLLVQSNKEFEAFKNFQKLIAAAKKVTLEMELKDIYWQLLMNFYWAAAQNSVAWEQALHHSLSSESAAHSLHADAWAVSAGGMAEQSYIFKDGSITEIPRQYAEFKFIDERRMVGIRLEPLTGRTILDLFEGSKVLDSRTFETSHEDIEIDHKTGNIVLVGKVDIRLVKIDDLDGQRTIPLPDFIDKFYNGIRLIISPDSSVYFMHIHEFILRIDVASGSVSSFQDPNGCWITKPSVAVNGDLYYVNYKGWTEGKTCGLIYRVSWKDEQMQPHVISAEGVEYFSAAIIMLDGNEFLVSSRKRELDVKDLSGQKPDKSYAFLSDIGYLISHPLHRNILYLNTDSKILFVDFTDLRDSHAIWRAKEVRPVGSIIERRLVPTGNPSKILSFTDSAIQIRTFHPEEAGLLTQVSSGSDCESSQSTGYSVCLTPDGIQWGDHEKGIRKEIKIPGQVIAKEVLPNGQLLFITDDRAIFVWTPEQVNTQFIGKRMIYPASVPKDL